MNQIKENNMTKINRPKAVFIKNTLDVPIYMRGMFYCAPDLMIASMFLEGIDRKIIKVLGPSASRVKHVFYKK